MLLFLTYVGFLGVVILMPLLRPTQVKDWKLSQQIIVFICMFLMFNNENMFPYLLPWVLILYGLSIKKEVNVS